ncbi:MAG: DUF6624 domain-containing protein [Bacteroidota bacterium]
MNTPQNKERLIMALDTIWRTEQEPIRLRDSLMRVYGAESLEFKKQEEIVYENHKINEKKILKILENQGWPGENIIGEQGSLTICNVIQHSGIEIRLKYLPMMRKAVKENELRPGLLARAEDRIATDQGELQIYGGQIKYYPETKSFNVWPIMDPENVDERRLGIGLEPMAEFLKNRKFPIEWNLDEQIKRTAEFKEKLK